jgi:hypothetical protein
MARAIQGLTTTQSESQLTWCPWHSPHHRRRGYGDGGGNGEDQGAPAMRYSAIGAARRMAVVGPNPPYPSNRRCTCELYRRARASPTPRSCGIGVQEVRLTHLMGAVVQQHLGGAGAPARACARRAGAPKPVAERTRTGGGGSPPTGKKGGEAPDRNYPRSAGREYTVVAAAALGGGT